MNAIALLTGLGGFALGVITGALSFWQFRRHTRENPSIQLTVRRGQAPGEYVLANLGFQPAYAVEVQLVSQARSTFADVVTREYWRHIQERSDVPFVVNLGEIARPAHEALITWHASERGGKKREKSVQIQRGVAD
ncbi:hypothetical protein QA943_18770 [Streptomyces sp. B21-097]|uniref:hypothetical protein n=1 Tax=Streptomyces sp. B21-097 TaxID=3039414 RepID=UPI002FEE7799